MTARESTNAPAPSFDRAMDKLRDEMAREGGEPQIDALGEMATMLLQARPGIAGAILEEKKTLGGAWIALKDYAGKHRAKANNYSVVPPDKALDILCDYYGVENPGMLALMRAAVGGGASGDGASGSGRNAGDASADPFDLDALLEG